ncbi:hypothetical protein Pan241w_59180 [Gimesia alba]|uniref:Adenosylcobinamide-GDP ribazoletransferase n=1 Tax=Gimesia alba TaxID=2527973 RepID=A0A517RPH5_9PLAN|nr:hypothetical protein [Gimesia alba]QDT45790.1 hypothetical protein Pan241w_59180 [Gimesia alba]
MNASSPLEGDPHSRPSDQNVTDWVDYIVAYFVAIQRYLRISFVPLQADRKEAIEKRSTLLLPLAGFSLGLLLTLLLALVQFIWPLGIAILLVGSIELVFLRTFVPESIPQCRELLASKKTPSSSGNIFVLTIVFMLLRMALFYQLLSDSMSLLTPCVLILISISMGTWIIPFSISFAVSHDETARWINPKRPLTKKQLCYGSLFLIPLFLLGTWASMSYLAPALLATAFLMYWIMRKLEDHDIEVTDTHIEGLAALFQVVFLLVCTIDFSFLKRLSE